MASTPLFLADLATLKSRLRLSGVPSGQDAEKIVYEGILRARLAFYRRLGPARVAVLRAISYDENPTDNDSLLRALANTVEVKLVHSTLLDLLPTMFMDGGGNTLEVWNEEAPVRRNDTPEVTKRRLLDEIEADMEILSGDLQFGEETSWQVTTNVPDTDPPLPGDTAYGNPPTNVFGLVADGDD